MKRSIALLPLLLLLLCGSVAQAKEIQLRHRDMMLNANLLPATDEWRKGTVILMTHGTVGHNTMPIMAGLQKAFQEQGITSLAITLSLGVNDRHGKYDCTTTHRHKHTDALDEIALWLDWLQKQGVEHVVMLGHSRGANQTAWFAAEHDNPVIEKIVLIAPPVWTAESLAKRYESRYGVSLVTVFEQANALVAAGKGDTLLEHTAFLNCKDASVSAATFVDYYREDGRFDTSTLLPETDRPVLVFAGSDDQVVPGLDDRLGPLAKQGIIKLQVLDGAGHMFKGPYTQDIANQAGQFIRQ